MEEPRADEAHRTMVRAALLFLGATVLVGALLRLELVTASLTRAGFVFSDVRHAHSHAGYYGVLALAWWAVALPKGDALRTRRSVLTYAAVAAVTSALFVFMGYRAPTIALSTVLALFWARGAWSVARGVSPPTSWHRLSALGMVVAVVLVPSVAVTAGRDLELSRNLAHLFLAVLLLCTFSPAAWQALGIPRRGPVTVHFLLVLCAAAQMVFPDVVGRWGMLLGALWALLIVAPLAGARLPILLKLYWLVVPASVLVQIVRPDTRGYMWRIAGIHFLVLGPIAWSFAATQLRARIPTWLGFGYHGALLVMCGSIAGQQSFPLAQWPMIAAASSAFLASAAAGIAIILWCANNIRGFTPLSDRNAGSLEPHAHSLRTQNQPDVS